MKHKFMPMLSSIAATNTIQK